MKKILLILALGILESINLLSHGTPNWREVGNLSIARTRHESVYIGYSKILVFGGTTPSNITNTAEIVDVDKNIIVNANPMKTPRAEFASLVTIDSLVLAIGGVTYQDDVTSSIEAYDIKTGIWSNFGSLIQPRRQFTVIWLNSTEFLAVGGREFGTQTIKSAEIFNITTQTSRRIADYPVYCNNPVSGYSSQGIPIVFGGREGGTGSNQSDNVYYYNQLINQWEVVGQMVRSSEFPPTIKLWDGRVVYTGGNNEIQRPSDWLNDIAIENNNTFTLLARMKTGRHIHFLSQWNTTTLLTGGGMSGSPFGSKSLNSTEWINIITKKVTDGPQMNHPHAQPSFLTIPIYANGLPIASKIVVISGFGEDFKFTQSVEILEEKITPCDNSYNSKLLPNIYVPIESISNNRIQITTSIAADLCPGNKLLIIQMRGAEVDSKSGDTYGKITSYSDAGNYEFTRISSINGNSITLEKPLTRSYNPAGKVQIVRVPEFNNYTVSDKIICPKWNDTIYGVLAFSVSDTLRIRQQINADGAGFSGGRAVNSDTTAQEHLDNYFGSIDPSRYAQKGDGLANYLSDEHRSARGALANSGGGGNNHNAGGGGGSNGGCGGKGGYGWDLMLKGSKELAQGLGGYALDNSSNKIFMGGGGGAGHSNEQTGTSGGNGGGIIIIDAKVIINEGGMISANGNSVKNAPYDGAGGGGGGGTVIIKTESVPKQLPIEIYGGSGGGVTVHKDGPGGGGGGGVVWFSLPVESMNASIENRGGYGGKSRILDDYGQTDGCAGKILTKLEIPGDNTVRDVSESNVNSQKGTSTVYPLPADELVTIHFDNQFFGTDCSVFDLLGNYIANGKSLANGDWQIDVSKLYSGVFFAITKNASESKMVRVIVRH